MASQISLFLWPYTRVAKGFSYLFRLCRGLRGLWSPGELSQGFTYSILSDFCPFPSCDPQWAVQLLSHGFTLWEEPSFAPCRGIGLVLSGAREANWADDTNSSSSPCTKQQLHFERSRGVWAAKQWWHWQSVMQATFICSKLALLGLTNQPVTLAAVSDSVQQLTSRGRVSTELTFPLTVSSSLSISRSWLPRA